MSRRDKLRNQISRLVAGTESESLYQQRKHLSDKLAISEAEIEKLRAALEKAKEGLDLYRGIAGNDCRGVTQWSAADITLATIEEMLK